MADLLLMTTIGGRRAVFPSAEIQSVVELEHIVPVPRAPAFVAGLTALRSRALTVIDACKAIGLNAGTPDDDRRAAVVQVDGHAYAIQVDGVDDVVEATSEVVSSDATFGTEWDRVSRGMIETTAGPAVVIDIAALIAGPDTANQSTKAA